MSSGFFSHLPLFHKFISLLLFLLHGTVSQICIFLIFLLSPMHPRYLYHLSLLLSPLQGILFSLLGAFPTYFLLRHSPPPISVLVQTLVYKLSSLFLVQIYIFALTSLINLNSDI